MAHANDIINALLKVLHPGAVGLIAVNHGANSYERASAAINEARTYLATSEANNSPAERLKQLKDEGLLFSDCINAFAAPANDPFVAKAHELIAGGGNDVSIDGATVTSASDEGALVLSWLWVSNEEAGVLAVSELLEALFHKADEWLNENETTRYNNVYADWLEDLLSNFAEELDDIENAEASRAPAPIVWQDSNGYGGTNEQYTFLPSEALIHLLRMAKLGGLDVEIERQAEAFINRYGSTLDSLLTVVGLSIPGLVTNAAVAPKIDASSAA